MISVIIPARQEDIENGLLARCLMNISFAKANCNEEVEVLPMSSSDTVTDLNLGASQAKGDIFIFTDCDNLISPNFIEEVAEKAKNDSFIGGGVGYIIFQRMSLGILTACLLFLPVLLFFGITAGAFWVRKEAFLAIGGFQKKYKYFDIDFAMRLKRYAKKIGKKFQSLERSMLIWNTRKFDQYGDWHWLFGYRTN